MTLLFSYQTFLSFVYILIVKELSTIINRIKDMDSKLGHLIINLIYIILKLNFKSTRKTVSGFKIERKSSESVG